MLGHMFASLALEPQHNFLGGRYLFVENGLGLSTVTGLFTVITSFSLSGDAVLTLLVLGDLVEGVLPALLALAVGFLRLRNVHLPNTVTKSRSLLKEIDESLRKKKTKKSLPLLQGSVEERREQRNAKMKELSENQSIGVHGIAGVGSVAFATAFTYPLDTMKVLIQVGSTTGKQLDAAQALSRVVFLSGNSDMRMLGDYGNGSMCSSGLMGNFTFVFWHF
ncbi:hypothetical protein V8G54_003505 [Vigna mungo]|uniref:Uncharacterized protein n=1 Tax=Vigna mungo TaxID=3915 RepID=A0AAQ3SDX3_VIGMU